MRRVEPRAPAGVAIGLIVSLVALTACGRGHHAALRAARPAPARAATTSTTAAPATTLPATTTTVAPTTTSRLTKTARPPVVPARVVGGGLALGDSVLEDVQIYAPTTLSSHGVAINAAVSRQWGTGEAMLSSLRSGGRLPAAVVIGLGTNGIVTARDFDAMMQAVAGATRVVFMTVTGPYANNNPVIAAGVARYPQAALADWAGLSAGHPNWFAPDKVHVGAAGAAALGSLLASRL